MAAPVFITALLALLVFGADQAMATHVSCGDVITTDTTLDSDLTDCPGDGLVIGADGIALDLNGHTIRSATVCPQTDGVDNRAGHSRVTVEDGAIERFGNGVVLAGASGNRLHGLVVGNCGTGVYLVGSRDNQITGTVAGAEGGAGIFFENADDNLVARNTVGGSSLAGIWLMDGSDHNRIVRNSAFGVGITRPFSGTGILVGSGRGNVVSLNRAIHNARRGILVDAGAVNTLVQRNVASGTGSALFEVGDGINVEEPATTLIGNRANWNGNLGIKAVPGVTDGGGNRASNNGNPAQCEGVACSP